MKHTDFCSQLENIKTQEILELTAAVNAHGGKVTFQYNMEPDDNAPILIFNPEGLLSFNRMRSPIGIWNLISL